MKTYLYLLLFVELFTGIVSGAIMGLSWLIGEVDIPIQFLFYMMLAAFCWTAFMCLMDAAARRVKD